MKVYIRFLRQGLAKVDAPDNFDKMTAKEKMEWADDLLQQSKDDDIMHMMSDFDKPEENGYFDEAPLCAAIEEAEGNDIGKIIVQTSDWHEFTSCRCIVDQNGKVLSSF